MVALAKLTSLVDELSRITSHPKADVEKIVLKHLRSSKVTQKEPNIKAMLYQWSGMLVPSEQLRSEILFCPTGQQDTVDQLVESINSTGNNLKLNMLSTVQMNIFLGSLLGKLKDMTDDFEELAFHRCGMQPRYGFVEPQSKGAY
jgi:hypothetical protein